MSVTSGSKWEAQQEAQQPQGTGNLVTCRGSYMLNSACGHCQRCAKELETMKCVYKAYLDKPGLDKPAEPVETLEGLEMRVRRLEAFVKRVISVGASSPI